LSFCCDVDGCRCRSTPPSVRFLSRRVYLGVMVVLISAMHQGPSPKGLNVLQKRFGVDRRTIARWQAWWRDAFPRTKFWRVARARCFVHARDFEFPRTIVERFRAQSEKCMAALLRFLSPMSGSPRFVLQVF
jgi:hypothetical protein